MSKRKTSGPIDAAAMNDAAKRDMGDYFGQPMTAKMTPGPWTLTKPGAVVREGYESQTVIYTIDGESAINGEANARAIAALPDLIAVVRELREWFRESGHGPTASSMYDDGNTWGATVAAVLKKAGAA